MRRLLCAAAAVAFVSCGCGAPRAMAAPDPVIDRHTAEDVAVLADELRSEALDGGAAGDLGSALGGVALEQLRSRAATMAHRGFRLEERSVTRSLVAWDARVPDAILQVEAMDRLVTPDAPDPAWSASARQVWSRFEHSAHGWRVVETKDLSPDRWRAA